MTVTLTAVIGAKNVPLTDCDWVLWKPCGCAQAVSVAQIPGVTVADEDTAWTHFADVEGLNGDDLDEALEEIADQKAAGWRVELITHARCKSVLDGWGKPCPHGSGVACRHCRKPLVRCDTLPSHIGCSSAYGWIHGDGGRHACFRTSGFSYAEPAEVPSP